MNSSERLDRIFSALADPTRRAILARLTAGETAVLDLARPFRMTQPAVSKHLRVLEEAGLVSQGRLAQQRPRKLEPKILAELDRWLEPYRPYMKADRIPPGGKS
jgi:DNA-binding transcriptional ArsR family regulator